MAGVDIHAFPPDLPPQPDTDDVDGDELERGEATHTAPLERVPEMPDRGDDAAGATLPAPACDYCGGAANLGVYYLADRSKEWVCYPCHAAMIAKALHEAADASEAEGAG